MPLPTKKLLTSSVKLLQLCLKRLFGYFENNERQGRRQEDEYMPNEVIHKACASVKNTHANVEVPKPFIYSRKTEYGSRGNREATTTSAIGETFRRMRDASTDGLTLRRQPSSHVESKRMKHRTTEDHEKERRTKTERKRKRTCARARARMRIAGIIFGLNRTKFSSRPCVSSVSYGPPCDSVAIHTTRPSTFGHDFRTAGSMHQQHADRVLHVSATGSSGAINSLSLVHAARPGYL